MWLIGHTASAYVICKSIWLVNKTNKRTESTSKIYKEQSQESMKKQIYRFPPQFLLLLFIFANWPDFFHFGIYRMFTHNLIAVVTIPIIILPIFIYYKIINRFEAVLLFVASITHMFTDVLFSYFNLLFPFQTTEFSVYGFNHPVGIIAEATIAIIFLIMFILSKDWKELTKFLTKCLIQFRKEDRSLFTRFWNNYMYIFIFMVFSLFALVQLLITITILSISDPITESYRILFILLFTAFVGILTIIFFKFTIDAEKKYNVN